MVLLKYTTAGKLPMFGRVLHKENIVEVLTNKSHFGNRKEFVVLIEG